MVNNIPNVVPNPSAAALPGPEKGLIESIFGSKAPETDQAKGPATSGEAVPSDFMKMLAQTQDQRLAQAAATKVPAQPAPTKGETQVMDSQGVVSGWEKLQHELAQAKVAARGTDKKSDSDVTTEAQAMAGAQVAAAMAQAQPKAKTPVPVETGISSPDAKAANTKSTKSTKATEQAAKKQEQQQEAAASQGMLGPQAPVQTGAPNAATQAALAEAVRGPRLPKAEPQGMMQAKAEATAQVVPAAKAAQAAQAQAQAAAQTAPVQAQAAVLATQVAAVQPAPVALQPIVIQMPMAVPMMMVETADVNSFDDDAFAPQASVPGFNPGHGSERSQQQLVSSQDFLAGRAGQRLGVDREDPRLVGRLENQTRRRQSSEASSDGTSNVGMMLPQVHGHSSVSPSPVGSDSAMAASAAGAGMVSTAPRGGNVDVSNAMALAAQVRGLAAQGGGVIRMKVMPESLGEVTISVQQDRGDKLNVKFEAASHDARNALAESLPELKEALQSSRYDVGHIEVSGSSSALSNTQPVQSTSWSGNLGAGEFGHGNTGGQGSRGDNTQGGSAWDRYLDEQNAREQSQQWSGGGKRNAYQQYQQWESAV